LKVEQLKYLKIAQIGSEYVISVNANINIPCVTFKSLKLLVFKLQQENKLLLRKSLSFLNFVSAQNLNEKNEDEQ